MARRDFRGRREHEKGLLFPQMGLISNPAALSLPDREIGRSVFSWISLTFYFSSLNLRLL